VYELFCFLASLINPYMPQTSEHQIGLDLINSALEVVLLSWERVGMFRAALRPCILVFKF
jgi:hypothetical protein